MRMFLATLVGAAVLATAVVSVRLHLHVAHLRYRLWSLDQDRARAEREHRMARADLEAAKAPRRLLERWVETHEEPEPVASPPSPAASADDRAEVEVRDVDGGPARPLAPSDAGAPADAAAPPEAVAPSADGDAPTPTEGGR